MTTRRLFGTVLFAAGLFAATAPAIALADDAKAANVSGTWTWTMERNGEEIKNTLKIKQEGEKLTGKVEGPRGEAEIADGKVEKDGTIKFKVTREFNGNSFTVNYSGKVEGDTLKLKSEMERDGEIRARDFEAKRVIEKG